MNLTAFMRSAMLPVDEIDAALPEKGIIYEIGSGWGSLANAIAEAGPKRIVIGIDTDNAKIKQAKSINHSDNVQFILGEALTFNYKDFSGVVMSDFLHHIDFETQKKILTRIASKITKNGVLVIKEISKNDGLLTICSRVWDFILYPRDSIYYREKENWSNILRDLGFDVSVKREVPWFPGSTFLFICIKK